MRFYVVGYTAETWQYPGNVTFFCYDEAGNLIEQFDFIQPDLLRSYEIQSPHSHHLCRPFRMAATQDGFIYSINTLMLAHDYVADESFVARNESVSKYDCNGFRREFSVDFQIYPRVIGTYYADRNRLTAITVNGNDQIIIGMQSDEFLSDATYNTYLISTDSDGNTDWTQTSPSPPYYTSGDDASFWYRYFESNATLNPLRVFVVDLFADDSGYLYILTSKFLEKRNVSGTLQWRRWMNPGTDYSRIAKVGGTLYIMVNADFYYDTDGYTKISYQPPGSYDYEKITQWSAIDGSFIGFVVNASIFSSASSDRYLRTEYGAGGGTNLYAMNSAYYKLDAGLAVLQNVSYHSVTAPYASPGRVFRIASDGTLLSTKESYEPSPIVLSANPVTVNWQVAIAANPVSGANQLLSCCTLIEGEWLPPIPVPIHCGVPGWTGDRYTSIPGTPLGVALGLLRFVSDPQVTSSALTILRMIIDDGSGTIELPLSSVSARYYSTGVFISAVSPKVTAGVASAIEAMGDACELIIRRGVLYSDGTQILSELVRGFLDKDNLRFDIGANSASITLLAAGEAEAPYNPRALHNISYRAEINGRRRVRCQLDTYLRPGGTAQISDSESMIVGSITYTVSASQELMEVGEAS